MGQITAIIAQKKNKKRCNLFIDGEYYCALDKMALLSFSLKVGDIVSTDKLKTVIKDSEEKSAFDAGIKFISVRIRSELELKRYLSEKKYDGIVIQNTIKKLKEYKYLDDNQFCKSYIAAYRNKYGNKKIAYELAKLGIDESTINSFLEADDEGELKASRIIAEKYIKTHQKKLSKQKIIIHLYSRGFSFEIAKKSIDELEFPEETDIQ